MVDIGDSVRGKDCYIIQTGTKSVDLIFFKKFDLIINVLIFRDCNNNIMELLIMAYAWWETPVLPNNLSLSHFHFHF